MDVNSIKNTYQFASWPQVSKFSEGGWDFNCRLGENSGYRFLNRYPLSYPKSYEDIYEGADPNVRISVKVLNCDSYAGAKEQLIEHFSQCTAPRLPQIKNQLSRDSMDLAFGAYDGTCFAISAVRGSALIEISNIGTQAVDLTGIYELLMQTHEETKK